MTGYPNVIGLIDGTHVPLTVLPKEVENGYVNHKGFHSINTQIVSKQCLFFTVVKVCDS